MLLQEQLIWSPNLCFALPALLRFLFVSLPNSRYLVRKNLIEAKHRTLAMHMCCHRQRYLVCSTRFLASDISSPCLGRGIGKCLGRMQCCRWQGRCAIIGQCLVFDLLTRYFWLLIFCSVGSFFISWDVQYYILVWNIISVKVEHFFLWLKWFDCLLI